jgi:hypothetical protein
MRWRLAAIVALTLAATLGPATASGHDGDDQREARVRVACASGRAELRLEVNGDDENEDRATIEVELRIDAPPQAQTWRIVLLHERTLVAQRTRRSTRRSGFSFRLRESVPNWPGSETFTARISRSQGRTCLLGATI